jgi:hypothetical protein
MSLTNKLISLYLSMENIEEQQQQQQQQQLSLLSQASWGRLEMKPTRNKERRSTRGSLFYSIKHRYSQK